jgi:predicted ribosome quality control (RQC) complex YloA/Tae2 family protein
MKSLRETKWFEKFFWFISSEGYLILGYVLPTLLSLFIPSAFWALYSGTLSNLLCSARDALQTELLIRKYFRKGDIYVHSDLQNSCVVVIKNPVDDGAIPPGTLAQAGIMSVATSRAWEVKQGITTQSILPQSFSC